MSAHRKIFNVTSLFSVNLAKEANAMKSKTTKKNVTKCHSEGGGSPRWVLAIDALVNGDSITEAATKTGYARETLSRLRHHNPVFKATLNRRRAESREEITARLRVLISEVIAAIQSALRNPELAPGATLQAGLAALPKLYELVAENERGATNAWNLASDMVPGLTDIMFQSDKNEAVIEKVLQQSEAELDKAV